MKLSRKIELTNEDLNYLVSLVKNGDTGIFHIAEFRRYLATKRLHALKPTVDIWSDQHAAVTPGTVSHNMTELTTRGLASTTRTVRLLGPLSSLSPIYESAATLKVLTIGPRTEMEMFHLLALGFKPKNIYGLDLITYSDYIKAGDMHNIPYDNDLFDVVISSWTLLYSSSPQMVVHEMLRVLKPNGLMAIGFTHDHTHGSFIDDNKSAAHIAGCGFQNADDFFKLFQDTRYKVHYLQEPGDHGANKFMTILRVKS
jgi:SAM-dependent methyltransferase